MRSTGRFRPRAVLVLSYYQMMFPQFDNSYKEYRTKAQIIFKLPKRLVAHK